MTRKRWLGVPGGEIPPCCLRTLLPCWPLCVEVAADYPAPITPTLLWVLLWTEDMCCHRDVSEVHLSPAARAQVAAMAHDLHEQWASTGSLDYAIVDHRIASRARELFGDFHIEVRDLAYPKAQRYLFDVHATLVWAHRTQPWVSPPRTRRRRCGKPLYEEAFRWLYYKIYRRLPEDADRASEVRHV